MFDQSGAVISTSALILGTLHGQAEIMDRLHEHGWTVHACGHRREGPGVDAADEFHLADIVDADQITELARRLDVDLVYSVGSDIAMPTIAIVSERLGLPMFHSSTITEVLHRKVLLRQFLFDHDLSPVAFATVRDARDLTSFDSYPAIVKPSDSQGQRGITIVGSPSEAEAALPAAIDASLTSTAVIEELLVGPEISIHVFVVDGAVEFLLPSDRVVWDGPTVGVPAAHVLPADITSDERGRVVALIDAFVAALDVETGPLYLQMKMTAEGPRIIEVAPRLDGCHLWRLVESYTGFNIADRCFELLNGEPWTPVPDWEQYPGQRLEFFLDNPTAPLRRAKWDASDVPGDVIYEEFQVDEGETPRTINPVVARFGYRIVRDADEPGSRA